MGAKRFEVVQMVEGGEVRLISNGVWITSGPPRIDLCKYLTHVIEDQTPVLVGAKDGEPATEATFLSSQFSVNFVAALVEEMVSKGYDQMKARVLTVLEGLLKFDKGTAGNKPEGILIGYALDDAKRVMLDVLARRAPEVTPEMIADAGEQRRRSEMDAAEAAATNFLEEQVRDLRRRLESAERRLEENRDRNVRIKLHDSILAANPDELKRIKETFEKAFTGPRIGRAPRL